MTDFVALFRDEIFGYPPSRNVEPSMAEVLLRKRFANRHSVISAVIPGRRGETRIRPDVLRELLRNIWARMPAIVCARNPGIRHENARNLRASQLAPKSATRAAEDAFPFILPT
jgi:hypothetical protein